MSTQQAARIAAPLPSGRHGLPREVVIASQRSRLIAAATHVAGSDGYAAMTVSTVIAHASVSRKTFYEQFADRETCFVAALDDVLARTLGAVRSQELATREAAWPRRLQQLLASGLEAIATHPCEARVLFVEALAAGPAALQRRDDALARLAQLLEPGYEAAPASVTIPQLMPEAVAGALYEVVRARVAAGRARELPQLLPDLLYCALAPFVGPAKAARAARA